MENSKDDLLDERGIAEYRERVMAELKEIRQLDEARLTPKLLVRKAMLMQFEDGSPKDVESALLSALQLDEQCIGAYIELGRFYYAVLDDSGQAKPYFEKALALLSTMSGEVVRGLLDCDLELSPDRDPDVLLREYTQELVGELGSAPLIH